MLNPWGNGTINSSQMYGEMEKKSSFVTAGETNMFAFHTIITGFSALHDLLFFI